MTILKSLDEGRLLITDEGTIHWSNANDCYSGESITPFPTKHSQLSSELNEDHSKVTLSVKETTEAGIVRVVWSVTLEKADSGVMIQDLMTVAMRLQNDLEIQTAKLSGMNDWEATAKKLEGLFHKEKSTLLRNFCEFYQQAQNHANVKLQNVQNELDKTREELKAANVLLAPDDTQLYPDTMVDQLAAGKRVQKKAVQAKKAPAKKAPVKKAPVKKAPVKKAVTDAPKSETTTRSTRGKRKTEESEPAPSPNPPKVAPLPLEPETARETISKAKNSSNDEAKESGKGFAAWLDSSDEEADATTDDAPPPATTNFFAKPPPSKANTASAILQDDDTDEDFTSVKDQKPSNVAPKQPSAKTEKAVEEEDFSDNSMEEDILAELEGMQE